MSTLIVSFRGKEICRLELSPDQEFTVGRDENCDVVLDQQKGISRQHLKLSFESDAWKVELLSRYGSMNFEGDEVDELLLDVNCSFSVGEYKFEFLSEAVEEAPTDEPVASSENANESAPQSNNEKDGEEKSLVVHRDNQPMANAPGQESPTNNDTAQGNTPSLGQPQMDDSSTVAGVSHLCAVLNWKDVSGNNMSHKVIDETCSVGRGENCDVRIKHKNMSRRHFEISRAGSVFYIVDLGSANGTDLNGKPVGRTQPVPLASGDNITILNLKFEVDIVDEQFERNLVASPNLMPVPPANVGAKVIKMGKNAVPVHHQYGNSAGGSKKLFKMAALAMVPILTLLMMGEPDKKDDEMKDLGTKALPFDRLSPDQQIAVKDTFMLAKNHWKQAKYFLCLEELKKLHIILPFFENSKEIEKLCQQALDIEETREAERRKELERQKTEQRIQAIVDDCKSRFNAMKSVDAARSCISPAVDYDPEHPEVVEFLNNIELREQRKREQASRRAARNAKVRAGQEAYEIAKGLFREEEFRKAISAYKRYLNRNYPDPKKLRPKARRELASAEESLFSKVKESFDLCKKLYEEKNYKKSIVTCRIALQEDPENAEVKSFEKKVWSELRREMKRIYEDSILEEHLGNVEAAKEKWLKIQEMDLPEDDYHKKATSKLKKYGIGI